MSNILMIYTLMEPPVLLHERPLRPIAEKMGCSLRLKQTAFVTWDDLLWSDVVFAIRTQSCLEADILAIASKMGRFCIEAIDDDFFSMEHYTLRRPLQASSLRKALTTADFIFSPNVTLAKKMSAIGGGKPYHVGDTVVTEAELQARQAMDSDQLHIVYYVNDSTTGVFDAIIKPILPDLVTKYRGRLKFTFMSVHPDLGEYESQMDVCFRPRTSLDEFKAFLRNNRFSMGIAPLIASPFAQSKYINKFIEFSSAGIPCIYSNVAPYASFIQDGETGLLCENTKEAWLAAIDHLSDPLLQAQIVENAQNTLRCSFSEEAQGNHTIANVPALFHHKAPANPRRYYLWPLHMKSRILNLIDPFRKAWGRFRIEGLSSVIRWTWNHYIMKKS
ncbi:MAG: glycosyltransferase family 4 protein [Ruminococcaceae bacterium]|nr:glycosyltransferase family 4 protein [Oscillospiraceae bacterium]